MKLVTFFAAVFIVENLQFVSALSNVSNKGKLSKVVTATRDGCDRRQAFSTLLTGAGLAFSVASANPGKAFAFPNKVSDKYDDRPKRRGGQPKDLGLATRISLEGEEYLGLKHCGAAPNCFSSTDSDDPDHVIPAWQWPADLSLKDAFTQLDDAIKNYKPGQGNIDGGGFQIVKSDLDKGYIYTQFESLKNGYIDDVEFAFINPSNNESANKVQVRSSSRIGYLDFGVNGKRLNYIAKEMKAKGWIAEGVNAATHEFYVMENSR